MEGTTAVDSRAPTETDADFSRLSECGAEVDNVKVVGGGSGSGDGGGKGEDISWLGCLSHNDGDDVVATSKTGEPGDCD